jgi:hypothetical protein
MEKFKIFDAATELCKLEDRVAKSTEEKVCISWLLVPKSACKEAKWDEDVLITEAIYRGKQRKKGEDVGKASWEDLDQEEEEYAQITTLEDAENLGLLSRSSEVSGDETTEEDKEVPGRVPRMRVNLLPGESGEQEEVHPDGLEEPPYAGIGLSKESQLAALEIAISRPEDFEQLWDCPACNYVNHVSEFQCPQCSFNRNTVEKAVTEFYMQTDNSSLEPQEHVAYLNGLIMLKTGNPNWHKLVISYMEEYNLKSEDMEGLMGPKPWEEAIMESESGVETVEVPATNAELTAALQDQKGTESEDPLSALGKSLRTKAELKAEQVEATEADIKSAFEEKVAEIADSDPRARVIVGDEVGWLCEECNRVWSLELKYCTICNKEYAAEVEKKEEAETEKDKSDLDVLKDKLSTLGTTLGVPPQDGDKSLYEEVKGMDGMKTAEKARLMLLLKEKDRDSEPDFEKKEEAADDGEEAPATPIL